MAKGTKQNKTITLTMSSKVALDLLRAPGTPKNVVAMIVKAFRSETVYPKGAISSAISSAGATTGRTSGKKSNKANTPKTEKSAMNGTTTQATAN